ncbi:hypothetical protein HYT74_00695 [Candidatus Daviesbacteria bacterium]|nr:hypothetical protein [Candidatus Daviesbacteria bacterium]
MKQKGLAPILIVLLIALGIGGYLTYQKQIKPVAAPQQVTQSIPTPSSNPESFVSTEFANWKTHADQKYNFTIKYPVTFSHKNKTTNKDGKTINIDMWAENYTSKPTLFYIYSYDNSINLDLKTTDFVSNYTFKNITEESIIMLNQKVKKTTFDKNFFSIGPLDKGRYNYTFVYFAPQLYPGQFEQFDQILSTFKFTDQVESPEGKFCGGIAANLPENQCPKGYTCQMDGSYPDAGGKCVKEQ